MLTDAERVRKTVRAMELLDTVEALRDIARKTDDAEEILDQFTTYLNERADKLIEEISSAK